MGDFDDSNDKAHEQTRDVNENAIPVANGFDVVGSPMAVTSGTVYPIDVSGNTAEIFFLPIGCDLKVGNDNPITGHDIIRDGAKEAVGVVTATTVYIQPSANGTVYFRKLKL